MQTMRRVALGLALALVVLGDVRAEAQPPQRQPNQDRLQRLQPGRGGPLLTPETKEKLNLTAEQRDKVAKLEKEFEDKTKDADTKAREALQKAMQDKDRAAAQKIRETMQAAQKVRTDYEDKVAAVLNDEQKKKLEEAKQTSRRPGVVRPNIRPLAAGADRGLTSKDVQEKLNLNDEQKTKLDKLQKEFEAKQLEVLSEEQKKKYEELKKQPARARIRPPGGN